ncbi:MAG: hypothetical protein LBJ64_13415 [Deltaproteobacteria bacterium]|jgi:hypothetical protein|nr:hypothetical protein [Deltaproteobacteria bacterium]
MFKSNVRAKYSRKFGQTDLGRQDRLFFLAALLSRRLADKTVHLCRRIALVFLLVRPLQPLVIPVFPFLSLFPSLFPFLAIPGNRKAEPKKKTAVFSRRAENLSGEPKNFSAKREVQPESQKRGLKRAIIEKRAMEESSAEKRVREEGIGSE